MADVQAGISNIAETWGASSKCLKQCNINFVGGQQKYLSVLFKVCAKKFVPLVPRWGILEKKFAHTALLDAAKQSTVGKNEKEWNKPKRSSLVTPHSSVLRLNFEPRSAKTILSWFLDVHTGIISTSKVFSNNLTLNTSRWILGILEPFVRKI